MTVLFIGFDIHYVYLKIGGGIEKELVPQKWRASSKDHLVALESLLVACYNGNVTEVLAASQRIHLFQGRVPMAR